MHSSHEGTKTKHNAMIKNIWAIGLALCMIPLVYGGGQSVICPHTTSGNVSQSTIVDVPSATTIRTSVTASAGWFTETLDGGRVYIVQEFASLMGLVSGPPQGLVHQAQAQASGGATVTDQKVAYNYPAGQYTAVFGGTVGTNDWRSLPPQHAYIEGSIEFSW